jgi:hypothetical protein
MRLLLALLIAPPFCFPQSSELLVRSNPSDAEVSINGTVVGRTPLTVPIRGVHLPYSLAVNKNGFETWYVQSFVEPGRSVINADLQSSGFTVERAETQFRRPREAEVLTSSEVSKAEPVRAVESTNSIAGTRQNDTAFKQRSPDQIDTSPPLDGKPRVYVEGTPNAWSFNNGSSGGGGSHPQLAEIMKTLGHSCPGLIVTNDPKKAQYLVTFERESKKILRKDSKLAVFNSSGDMVYSSSTRALGNGVRGFCSSLR